ncbi:hypothetical protein GQX73_g1667 [Xylaria multiplex]|uniref:Uncharacterized protein n=1 Tax=Xylaria multiplex TaxID=323545 RepID=A0A7C8J073_9PEZI|nr:hypothetical protein GQX73_g1667 [Xylaria multiplex]
MAPSDSIFDLIDSSIGVELEFLLCYPKANLPVKIPLRDITGSQFRPPDQAINAMIEEILRVVDNAVDSLGRGGGDYVLTRESRAPEDIHLLRYRGWETRPATNYYFPSEARDERFARIYLWYPFKVISPAFWATDESWNEIHTVVQAIRTQLNVIIPPGASTHFHYGNGKSYIPFNKLRRIAALLVAVDPMIAQLNPEYKRNDDSALSNRLYSRIAHGRTAADIAREIGAEYVEGEPDIPVRRRRPIAYPIRIHRRRPDSRFDFAVPWRRGQLTGYSFSREIFRSSGFPQDNFDELGALEIPVASREILRSPNAPTVAELMRYGPQRNDRPAYSFLAYTLGRYKRVLQINGEIDARSQYKRTIEFRQMASTLNPEEVVAFGKVVVRLCEFAGEADLDKLWNLILDCAVAETHNTWYDVFDLLGELGLISEAKVLYHPVARFRGEKVPEGDIRVDGAISSSILRMFGYYYLFSTNEEGVWWWNEWPVWYKALFGFAIVWVIIWVGIPSLIRYFSS